MSYSGDAAEQVMRISLEGVEVAAKISGKAAERLAALIYAVLKDQKKTHGKMRLSNMLKSEKPMKVFAVHDADLQKFCREAKKYGVLYCVLKDTKSNDGLTDIMVRADDASKVNRIFERFKLSSVDMGSIKAEITRDKEEQKLQKTELQKFLDDVVGEHKDNAPNPIMARVIEPGQSEPSSRTTKGQEATDISQAGDKARRRPSVREELKAINLERKKKTPVVPEIERVLPKVKDKGVR